MSLLALDTIDDKLIDLLSCNARLSYVDLAEVVGISAVAVKKRVEHLEKRGIIEGYIAIINPLKISQSISMFFDIVAKPGKILDVAERLSSDPHITQVYLLTGSVQLHVHGVFISVADRAQFMQNVLYKIPDIESLSSHDIIDRIKDLRHIRL